MKRSEIQRGIALLCSASLLCILFTGCRSTGQDDLPLSGKSFAIVVKVEGNSYFESIVSSFTAIIESQGGRVIARAPSQATAEEQITIVNGLISDRVDFIAIATNSELATAPVLQRATDQGIHVISFDSAAYPGSRALHINQADAKIIAETLMDAAQEITGGYGQIAIMSTTNQAHNQNTWIAGMRALLEAGRYPGLTLVRIVYGEDDYQTTYERTQYLTENYPELSLIIAPTAAGIPAVAANITRNRLDHRIKVTGLGMPSQMVDYIGRDRVCPYMFLWNLDEVGKLTAYAAIGLVTGEITGEVGETLIAGDMGRYSITHDPFGGTEIVLQAEPIRFDENNIDYWKNVH
jgi:rhamnose transport system substrate-binding protein